MFRDGQRQYQSQRAAKPTPYDCELVVEVNALGETQPLRWRQKHERRESSCTEPGSDDAQ